VKNLNENVDQSLQVYAGCVTIFIKLLGCIQHFLSHNIPPVAEFFSAASLLRFAGRASPIGRTEPGSAGQT
jgi:hypothetical protein